MKTPHRIRLQWIAAAALGAVMGVGCDGGAAPQADLEVGTLQWSQGISDAEMEDLEFIAQERGWTIDEAVARIGWQRAFDEAVEAVRAAHPDQLAGAEITPEGPHQAWVGFAGEVPAGVRALPGFQGVDVEFRAHKGFTEARLLAQLLEVHHAIYQEGYEDIITTYDLDDGTIEVQLALGSMSPSREAIVAALPEAARAPNVEFQFIDSSPEELEVLSGGATMSTCTAGFTVSQGLTRGILTAGHCGNTQSMRNNAGGWQTLTFRAEHEGGWGDMQWHTTSADTFNSFFQYDTNLRRDTWRIGTASQGRTVCRFGRTTGRQCDDVKRVNVSAGSHDRLVMMSNDEAEGGDSGGPWYYGSTAYGLHRGSKVWWFKSRDLWTQAVNVDNGLNVNLLLCQPFQTSCRPGDCGSVGVGCGRTLYCGVCGGCSSNFDCYDQSECGSTGGMCSSGVCNCY